MIRGLLKAPKQPPVSGLQRHDEVVNAGQGSNTGSERSIDVAWQTEAASSVELTAPVLRTWPYGEEGQARAIDGILPSQAIGSKLDVPMLRIGPVARVG